MSLLTTAQAAKALKCSVWTVHRMVRSGQLPVAAKLPSSTGAYLFDPAAVEVLAKTVAA